jgi:hypothetical protein
MFWHMDILSQWTFRYEYFSAQGLFGTGTLQHWEILARGHSNTGKFQHHTKQYGCFDTDILAPVPKCVAVLNHPFCQNIHALKCSSTNMLERIYNSHYGNGVPAMFTS